MHQSTTKLHQKKAYISHHKTRVVLGHQREIPEEFPFEKIRCHRIASPMKSTEVQTLGELRMRGILVCAVSR